MVKPEWGTKRTCQSCGAKYYDMLRDPVICPRCETEYVEPAPITSRRGRSAKVSRIPEPKEENTKDTENSDEENHYKWIEILLISYYDKMYEYQLEQKKDRCIHIGSWLEIFEYLSNYKS